MHPLQYIYGHKLRNKAEFHNIVIKAFVLLSIFIVEVQTDGTNYNRRINIRLHVRVIHIWTIPEFNRPREDGSIHLLLLDEKVC